MHLAILFGKLLEHEMELKRLVENEEDEKEEKSFTKSYKGRRNDVKR